MMNKPFLLLLIMSGVILSQVPARAALELMTEIQYEAPGEKAAIEPLFQGSETTARIWVQFRDKGFQDQALLIPHLNAEETVMSRRTLSRRAKVLSPERIVQIGDLPVHPDYLEGIRQTGVRIRSVSRWFNAAGVEADKEQIRKIQVLPYVYRIETIKRASRPLEPVRPVAGVPGKITVPGVTLDYGLSGTQVRQIQVNRLHELGLTGKGIVIGVLDTGFATASVAAFDHAQILGQRDFIDGDDNPVETPDHGTSALSCIAAFAPGTLIGTAWEASFLLGRSEILDREIHLEEDLWAAGVEWMEQQGADIVSSSLGYNIFDDGSSLVLDGVSSTITRSASAAIDRGVFVVNSAGNEGFNGVVAPADGFNVCAVGAVDGNGFLASFSSRGPTTDGRTKPDIMAQGVNTVVARATQFDQPLWTTDTLPAGDIFLVTGEIALTGDTQLLRMTFLLVDGGTGNASMGRPGLSFDGGMSIVLRRGSTDMVLFDSPFNETVLRAPSPSGFSYTGSRVVSVGSALETVPGNEYDIALEIDFSSILPPGGARAGDILQMVTTARHMNETGLRVYLLTDGNRQAFGQSNGTSFSCPVAAGAAALLLQANPGWGPKDLLNALRKTASVASSPNNNMGWGIANAYQAAFHSGIPAAPDLDGNGLVDSEDLLNLIRDWKEVRGSNETDWGLAFRSDLNRDFQLNHKDLLLFHAGWAP